MRKNFKRWCLILFFVFVSALSFKVFSQDLPASKDDSRAEAGVETAVTAEPQAEERKGEWGHESELGVALAGGNTDAKTLNARQMTKYEWASNLLRLDALFLWSFSNGATTARNWMGGIRYERIFTDRVSAFLGNSYEGDTFAGFDYRINADVGGKYYLFRGDKKSSYLFGEAGYRFSYENRTAGATPDTINIHFIRTYFEGAKAITGIVFVKVWTEFLPDLTDKSNFLFNFEPSLGVILSRYLSLKLAYLGRYDNEPAQVGLKKFDWLYTTSLVAKF